MDGISIGEVARQTGLRTSALRYYESIGLIPPPLRHSGRRVYAPDVVQWVGVIQLAKAAGFTMAEIQTLMHGFSIDTTPAVRWQTLAEAKLVDLTTQIQRLQQMHQLLLRGLQCNCLRLEDCVITLNGTCESPSTDVPWNQGCVEHER